MPHPKTGLGALPHTSPMASIEIPPEYWDRMSQRVSALFLISSKEILTQNLMQDLRAGEVRAGEGRRPRACLPGPITYPRRSP